MIRRSAVLAAALLTALVRWPAGRRPGAGPWDREFGYAAGQGATSWLVLGVTLIEGAAVMVLVPWPVVHHILLVVHGAALLLMLGSIAAVRTRPHLVGPSGVRARSGALREVAIPLGSVAGAFTGTRVPRATWPEIDGDGLHLPVAGQTNVRLVLGEPQEVALSPGAAITAVREIHLYADDPVALVGELDARRAMMEPSGG